MHRKPEIAYSFSNRPVAGRERPLLCYITDRRQFEGDRDAQFNTLLERIQQAAAAGVDYVQLREKDLCGRELEQLARRAAAIVEGTATKLLINSRADIAIACGLAGVHLPSVTSAGLGAADARAVFHRAGIAEAIIGVSCHSTGEVLRAWSEGADFAVLGPVFEKQAPEQAPIGLTPFKELSREPAMRMPVLALGGITMRNAAECIQAGAAGLAAIRLFQDGDIRETVRALRRIRIAEAQQ